MTETKVDLLTKHYIFIRQSFVYKEEDKGKDLFCFFWWEQGEDNRHFDRKKVDFFLLLVNKNLSRFNSNQNHGLRHVTEIINRLQKLLQITH